jgi:hypothetical protein
MPFQDPFAGLAPTNPFDALSPGNPPGPPKNPYGIIPPSAPLVDDLFASLLELRWRDIGIPAVEIETELVQGQVIHKFADRDSAHIEPVGRHPLRITARVPFINYIRPARNETWPARQLYPDWWRAVFEACADRTSDKLQHPELGTLICKCESHRTRWSGDVRGGVFVSISWIESDDTANDLASALAEQSPAASVFNTAAAIDAALNAVSPIVVPTPYVPPISFTDLANAVRGVSDQATLFEKSFAGRIDNMIYEANALEDSLAAVPNALNWPIVQMCEELKASCHVLKLQLLNSNTQKILFYTVTQDSTLAQVANALGAPVDDIMILNPAYVSIGVVPQDTKLRYYAAA